MENWQRWVVLIFSLINTSIFIKSYFECRNKNNSYGEVLWLSIFGIFVWGDGVVFGLFWAIVSIIILVINNWYLFWLIYSVFWTVRSLGETIYWFNQQFSSVTRISPERSALFPVFKNDSVWFIHQIISQCITVIAVILSIYFARLWLQTI